MCGDKFISAMRLLGQWVAAAACEYLCTVEDNTIDFVDYVVFMTSQKGEEADAARSNMVSFRELFVLFDTHGNWELDGPGMKIAAEQLGELFTDEQVAGILVFADVDGDGFISFCEFIQLMTGTSSDVSHLDPEVGRAALVLKQQLQ